MRKRLKLLYTYIVEDAHGGLGIPLLIISWSVLALVIFAIGYPSNITPQFYERVYFDTMTNVHNNWSPDRTNQFTN